MSLAGLTIEKGQRHCKILNQKGEVIFRTTNQKDAEQYVELCNENVRLNTLLESRGIAPHRIYLLAHDETKRGRVYADNLPAHEVVITAKAENAVVVRRLHDGKEEIVDLEELEPIQGGSYLRAADIHEEAVQVLVCYNHEEEQITVSISRDKENASETLKSWVGAEEAPGDEYVISQVQSEGDSTYYLGEILIED